MVKAVAGSVAMGLCAVLGASPGLAQDAGDALIRGLKEGKGIVDVRIRYEDVNDSNFDDRAKGLTVRTRLGYQTASMGGFRLLGEFTDTRPLAGVDDYSPEQPGFPTIADPSNTSLNRAVVSYEMDSLWLGLGRQRIKLDNDRWVGNVGWRQKEQTFDAGSIDINFNANWTLSYDYLTRVNGIVEKFDADVSDHIANLAFTGWNAGSLVAYGYFLKDDDSDDTNNSVGLRFNGQIKPGTLAFLYTAEYARQVTDSELKGDFNADYYTLMAGLGMGPATLKLGYEVLGSDGGDYGLQTPLATKHAFNGWADQFLTTPVNGLRDAYIDLGANWLGIKWGAIYHDFTADEGSDRYGSEIDLLVAKKFNSHYTLGLKYADFRADSDVEDKGFRDVSKFWVWFDFKY